MVEPVSILSGIIAGDAARKLSKRLNSSDDEIRKQMENGNVEEAIQLSDKTTSEHMYNALVKMSIQDDIDISDRELYQFKQRIVEEKDIDPDTLFR